MKEKRPMLYYIHNALIYMLLMHSNSTIAIIIVACLLDVLPSFLWWVRVRVFDTILAR